MFKVNDLIKIKENIIDDNKVYASRNLFKVTAVSDNHVSIINMFDNEKIFSCSIHFFVLVERKPITEVEFLDAFQTNFSKGV